MPAKMRAVARVKEIWRYPVKSMGGERLDRCQLSEAGLVGDRLWAVTAEDGSIKSARQWPALIALAARYGDVLPQTRDCYAAAVPEVFIEFPDGRRIGSRTAEAEIDRALAAYLDRPCRLEALRAPDDAAFYAARRKLDSAALAVELDQQDNESSFDFSETPEEMLALLSRYMTPPGTFFDTFPLHLISAQALDHLAQCADVDTDRRRFRPNLLLEFYDSDQACAEFGLIGRSLRIGAARIAPQGRTLRCSIPSRAQPVLGLEAAPRLTRAMVDHMERHLGIYANVLSTGQLAVGDEVFVEDEG